jgi:hypothetical protein
MSERDEMIGAALRALPVPEHRAGFAQRRPRVLPVRPLAVGVALAAAAAAVAAVLPLTRAGTASAADVQRRVAAAFASATSVSGDWVIEVPGNAAIPARGLRSSFVLARDGSFVDRSRDGTLAYDAPSQTTRDLVTGGASRRATLMIRTHVDPANAVFATGGTQYVSGIQALLEAHDPRVHDTTYEGRPAWDVDLRFGPRDRAFYLVGRRVHLVVDRDSGFIVRVESYLTDSPQPSERIRVENLRVDVDTAPDMFAVDVPPGTSVRRADEGYSRVTPNEAAALVGYRPLLPTAPDGFELQDLAAAKVSTQAVASYLTRALPSRPRRDAVTAVYRRGLEALVVSSRRDDEPAKAMYEYGETQGLAEPRPTRIASGPLAGPAYVSASPLQATILWAYHDGVLVTLTGTVGERDLRAAAESLRAG